jgi:hypothetical protein
MGCLLTGNNVRTSTMRRQINGKLSDIRSIIMVDQSGPVTVNVMVDLLTDNSGRK